MYCYFIFNLGNNKSECGTMLFFDVFMPSLDVYSDLSLVVPWYLDGHPSYALMMSLPPLLNFLFSTYKWWCTEKRSEKKWSWILLLLQFYQQWKALKVIRLLWKGDKRANDAKKEMLKEASSLEPFLEATPATIIMTMIWLLAFADAKRLNPTGLPECTDAEYLSPQFKNFCAVFGGFGGTYWFFTSYAISVITSALGITKFLQNGPFAILSNNGTLNGLLTWRFILAYYSVMLSLITKAIFAAVLMGLASGGHDGPSTHRYDRSTKIWIYALMFIMMNIFPHILMSIINIASSTGCSKKMMDIIFNYPALLILPAFTHFAVGPETLSCCGKWGDNYQRHRLVISTKCTIINMALTLLFYGLVMVISCFVVGDVSATPGMGACELFFGYVMPPILISSVALTLIFLSLEKQCCCSGSQRCFCSCCCGPQCYEFRKEYINTVTKNEV